MAPCLHLTSSVAMHAGIHHSCSNNSVCTCNGDTCGDGQGLGARLASWHLWQQGHHDRLDVEDEAVQDYGIRQGMEHARHEAQQQTVRLTQTSQSPG